MLTKILKTKLIAFLFLFILGINHLFAQMPDGTFCTTDFLNVLLSNRNAEKAMQFDTSSVDLNVTLSIDVYVLRDSNGNATIDNQYVLQCVSKANEYFKPLGIRFSVSSVNIVDDYHYSYLDIRNMPAELLKKHAETGKINLYLVDEIMKDSVTYYGFTYFPVDTEKNSIFITKEDFQGNLLTTQLGHFLGLLSTHEGINGLELVNGNNCTSNGDLICDTYADPNIFGNVNDECLYKGTVADTNGEFYIPSVANIMSDSRPACKCIFTLQQYRRMFYYYKKYRQYLR